MNLTIRQKAIYLFLILILMVISITLIALYQGVYSYYDVVFAALALAIILISLIPFFISLYLFKAYLEHPEKNTKKKYLGLFSYFFCFPLNLWFLFISLNQFP